MNKTKSKKMDKKVVKLKDVTDIHKTISLMQKAQTKIFEDFLKKNNIALDGYDEGVFFDLVFNTEDEGIEEELAYRNSILKETVIQ